MTSSSNRPVQTTTVTAESDQERAPALDLSVTKVAGGALAAVTTAVAASFLGVTGTLTGAAFGSIVSSVAAAFYAASFKTAHTRIRATRTLVTRTGQGAEAEGHGDPAALPPELTGRAVPLPGETMILPAQEGYGGPPAGAVPPFPEHRREYRSTEYRAKRRVAWKPLAALTGLIFVSAMAVIFATEVFIGHPISNSSGTGTTVSHVVQGDTSSKRTTEPSVSESPSSSRSESASPSDSPSDSSSPSPSPSDSGSGSPTRSDSASSTDGQSPSTSDGGQGQNGQYGQDASPTASAPAAPAPSDSGGGEAVPTATP